MLSPKGIGKLRRMSIGTGEPVKKIQFYEFLFRGIYSCKSKCVCVKLNTNFVTNSHVKKD